jgi:hypothetical protein
MTRITDLNLEKKTRITDLNKDKMTRMTDLNQEKAEITDTPRTKNRHSRLNPEKKQELLT